MFTTIMIFGILLSLWLIFDFIKEVKKENIADVINRKAEMPDVVKRQKEFVKHMEDLLHEDVWEIRKKGKWDVYAIFYKGILIHEVHYEGMYIDPKDMALDALKKIIRKMEWRGLFGEEEPDYTDVYRNFNKNTKERK